MCFFCVFFSPFRPQTPSHTPTLERVDIELQTVSVVCVFHTVLLFPNKHTFLGVCVRLFCVCVVLCLSVSVGVMLCVAGMDVEVGVMLCVADLVVEVGVVVESPGC